MPQPLQQKRQSRISKYINITLKLETQLHERERGVDATAFERFGARQRLQRREVREQTLVMRKCE